MRVAGCPPAISRTLRRDGIVFEHLRCWHPIFSQWLERRARPALQFGTRNLPRPYGPHKGDDPEVPFSDLRMPSVSGSQTSRAMPRYAALCRREAVPPCHRATGAHRACARR